MAIAGCLGIRSPSASSRPTSRRIVLGAFAALSLAAPIGVPGEPSSARSTSSGSGWRPSSGSRRRRCGSASAAARRACDSSTSSAPSSAASARAALAVTRSPRTPSTPSCAHAPAIRSSSRSGRRTVSRRSRAAAMRAASSSSGRTKRSANADGIALEREPAAHDLGALACVARRAHLDAEAEAVEQLRAQLALLDVHRADEDEARVVRRPTPPRARRAPRQTPPRRAARRRGGRRAGSPRPRTGCPDARREACPARSGGRPASAWRRSSEPTSRSSVAPSGSSTSGAARRSVSAPPPPRRGRRLSRAERVRLADRRIDRRQQRRERAHRRRLRRPALAAHEHAADLRGDRVHQQRLDQRPWPTIALRGKRGEDGACVPDGAERWPARHARAPCARALTCRPPARPRAPGSGRGSA